MVESWNQAVGRVEPADFDGFLAVKELLFAGVMILGWGVLQLPILAVCIVSLIAFFLPDFRLQDQIRSRTESMRTAFIPFLDLLSLVLEAGLDFNTATALLKERLPPGALADELNRMHLEMKLGMPREKALQRFADRIKRPEMESFIAAVIQSERSGSVLSGVIRNLAVSLKTARIQAAEKAAQEAPIKLLAPLVLFIFPVVFLVLFGPIVLGFLQ